MNSKEMELVLDMFVKSLTDENFIVPKEYTKHVTLLYKKFEEFKEINLEEIFSICEKIYEQGYCIKSDMIAMMKDCCTVKGVEEHVTATVEAFFRGDDITLSCYPLFVKMVRDGALQ